jgi:hypothetical protein
VIWWRWDENDKCWRPTLVPSESAFRVSDEAQLIPVGARGWALLAADGVKVNGLPCLPIEILVDRDEVYVAGAHYCFSQLSPPEVVAFVSDKKSIRCARCLERLVDGDQIVRCPSCRAHHHATCWTYDARCQKCPLPTDGAVWIPDSLN